jgi:hypothetical protein
MTTHLTIAAKQGDSIYAYVVEKEYPNTTITYNWYRDGEWLPGNHLDTYLLTQADVGHVIQENTTFTTVIPGVIWSQRTEPGSYELGFKVLNVNDLPEGEVTISGITDVAQAGTLLTATNTLSDIDGLGSIRYQWLRNGKVITGATSDTYALSATDNNKNISVKASYTDAFGAKESVTSDSNLFKVATLPKTGYTYGNDIILGTPLVDLLTGGRGSDIFVFTTPSANKLVIDTITDFKSYQNDKIDVAGIDANTTNDAVTLYNDSFQFIGTDEFSEPGQLRFDPITQLLTGNTDLDSTPEFSVVLTGVKSLTAADFAAL